MLRTLGQNQFLIRPLSQNPKRCLYARIQESGQSETSPLTTRWLPVANIPHSHALKLAIHVPRAFRAAYFQKHHSVRRHWLHSWCTSKSVLKEGFTPRWIASFLVCFQICFKGRFTPGWIENCFSFGSILTLS